MFKSQKHVFWEALILAIFIFASGILLGYFVEQSRTNKIITAYQEAELNLLDVQIQQNLYSQESFDCNQAIKETIDFADKTYEKAKILEKYGDSARLTEGIIFQHKKYDLLRVILWTNSMIIKEKCEQELHTVVYFYYYDPRVSSSRDQDLEAVQDAFSKYLAEVKQEYGNKVILIPIAGNLDINSVSFLKETYNIQTLPSVLVDEELKIDNMNDLNQINAFLS